MDNLPQDVGLYMMEFLDINDCKNLDNANISDIFSLETIINDRTKGIGAQPTGKQLHDLIMRDNFNQIEAYTIKFGSINMITSMIIYSIMGDLVKYLKFFIEYLELTIDDLNSFPNPESNIPRPSTFSKNNTLLSYVVFYDSIECLKYLINIGVDVNYNTNDSFHPLMFAMRYMSTKCFKILLECSRTQRDILKINMDDGCLYNNILFRMINIHSEQMFKNVIYILNNYEVYNMLNSDDPENILVIAIRSGNVQLIDYLIDYGVSYPQGIFPSDIFGNSIVHHAILNRNNYPDLFRRVMKSGQYHLDSQNRKSRTPLSLLIRNCTLEELKMFVESSERNNKNCSTPILICNSHEWGNYNCLSNESKSGPCIISDNDMFIAFMYQTNLDVLEYIIKRKSTIIRSCPTVHDTIMDVIGAREIASDESTSEMMDVFIDKINAETTSKTDILRDLVEKYLME